MINIYYKKKSSIELGLPEFLLKSKKKEKNKSDFLKVTQDSLC